jgi:hypothetical protein
MFWRSVFEIRNRLQVDISGLKRMARFWKTPQKTAEPFDITFREVILTALPYCPAITQ